MALGSTQPLTEMSIPGTFPGGKGGRWVRLTTLLPSCAFVTKSGNLNFLETSGPLRACNGNALHFTLLIWNKKSLTANGFELDPPGARTAHTRATTYCHITSPKPNLLISYNLPGICNHSHFHSLA